MLLLCYRFLAKEEHRDKEREKYRDEDFWRRKIYENKLERTAKRAMIKQREGLEGDRETGRAQKQGPAECAYIPLS